MEKQPVETVENQGNFTLIIVMLSALIVVMIILVLFLFREVLQDNEKISLLEYSNKEIMQRLKEPILVKIPDGRYLLIFNKLLLKRTSVNRAQLTKSQVVRLLSWQEGREGQKYFPVYTDTNDYFAFLLTREEIKHPSNLQLMEQGVWTSFTSK